MIHSNSGLNFEVNVGKNPVNLDVGRENSKKTIF